MVKNGLRRMLQILKSDDQPIVSDDNQDTAYSKVKEALTADTKHEIVGIQCAAMSETPGAAQAVEELGLQGESYISQVHLLCQFVASTLKTEQLSL